MAIKLEGGGGGTFFAVSLSRDIEKKQFIMVRTQALFINFCMGIPQYTPPPNTIRINKNNWIKLLWPDNDPSFIKLEPAIYKKKSKSKSQDHSKHCLPITKYYWNILDIS